MPRVPARLGLTAVIAIVCLRLAIGWHFFTAGVEKFSPTFSSRPFLELATGPFAPLYQNQIPDRWGEEQLDIEKRDESWQNLREWVVNNLGVDKDEAKKVYADHKKLMDDYVKEKGSDIEKYLFEVERLRLAENNEGTRGVAKEVEFQREWVVDKNRELRGSSKAWIADIEAYDDAYRGDLLALVNDENTSKVLPAKPNYSIKWIDRTVLYWTLGVGILLILGLFTRTASIAGALFLLSVLSTQPPWVKGAETTYWNYQLVELIALVFLAAIAAGRFGGLDFFIHHFCCSPKKEGSR
ncbi:MAG: DoxX family protein [Pirellulaceae bacterium]|nr:DoxX family protein [Planctomycetales bacterium]